MMFLLTGLIRGGGAERIRNPTRLLYLLVNVLRIANEAMLVADKARNLQEQLKNRVNESEN